MQFENQNAKNRNQQNKQALLDSGQPIFDPRNGVTTPLIDLEAAVALLLGTPPPPRDTTPPSGPVSLVVKEGGTTQSTRVSLAIGNATDVAGDRAPTLMCFSNSASDTAATCRPYLEFANTATWSLQDGADGDRTVRVFIGDYDGNWLSGPAGEASTYLARMPSVSVLGGVNVTAETKLQVSVSAPLAISWTEMCVTVNPGCKEPEWVPYAPTATVALGSRKEGLKTITAFFRYLREINAPPFDFASTRVRLDLKPPSLPPSAMQFRAVATSNTSVDVTFLKAARDGVSGVASYVLVGAKGPQVPPPQGCVAGGNATAAGQLLTASVAGGVEASGAVVGHRFQGLEPNAVYSFRLCAVDGVGRVAKGQYKRVRTKRV